MAHREQFIQSRSNKAGVHFGEVLFAFSPQRKQAGSKPPKWYWWRSQFSCLASNEFKLRVSIIFDFATSTQSGQEPYKQPVPRIRSADQKGETKQCVTAQLKSLESPIRLTIHPDDRLLFRNGEHQKQRERMMSGWGKSPHFDRLRRRKGWEGQSRRNAEIASEA